MTTVTTFLEKPADRSLINSTMAHPPWMLIRSALLHSKSWQGTSPCPTSTAKDYKQQGNPCLEKRPSCNVNGRIGSQMFFLLQTCFDNSRFPPLGRHHCSSPTFQSTCKISLPSANTTHFTAQSCTMYSATSHSKCKQSQVCRTSWQSRSPDQCLALDTIQPPISYPP